MTDVEPSGPSTGGVRQAPPAPGTWEPLPDGDSEGALSRLLDVLLDKGVYLDLDAVITVAGVPLIAVNLRATIAGVQTMLDWGVPGVWDEGRAPRAVPEAPRHRAVEGAPAGRAAGPDDEQAELPAAMSEARSGSTVWRTGTLLVRSDGTVQWRGDGDRRPRLAFDLRDLEDAAVAEQEGTQADGAVVVLRIDGRSERLASRRAGEIVALLSERRRATIGRGRMP